MGDFILAIGGDDGAFQGSDRVDILDSQNVAAGWQAGPAAPYRPLYALAVGVDQGVLLIGGVNYDTNTPRAEVWLLDRDFTGWTKVTDMPAFGGTAKGHCVGGVLGDGRVAVAYRETTAVHILNPADWTWETAPPLPTARTNFATATLGTRLFVSGGYVSATRTVFTQVDVLDTATMAWSVGRPIPQSRRAHVLVADAGNPDVGFFATPGLVAHGGLGNGALQVDRYNVTDDAWYTELTNLSDPPYEHAGVATPEAVFVAGGWRGGWPSAVVELLTLTADGMTIAAGPALPVGRYGLAMAALRELAAQPEPEIPPPSSVQVDPRVQRLRIHYSCQ